MGHPMSRLTDIKIRNARPAAQRVNELKNRHSFKSEMDDAARKAMFPQNERLKA